GGDHVGALDAPALPLRSIDGLGLAAFYSAGAGEYIDYGNGALGNKLNEKTHMSAKTKTRQTRKNKAAASLVWFEIPAENLERASAFYGGLFGWKIRPFPGMKDYWHIDTGGSDDSPDGALMARMCPEHPV